MKIENRTFLISGGGSGLGRATTIEIFKKGGYVAIIDINKSSAEEVIAGTCATHVKFFETDVTDAAQVGEAVKNAARWSVETGARLGGIVAAAGVGNPALMIDRHGTPLDLDGFKFVQDINVFGTVSLISQAVPELVKVEKQNGDQDEDRGIIIMVASAAAYEGQSGQVSYAASKGAVVSMTLPMARDLSKYGIRCITLAPAMFDSPMTENMRPKVKESLLKSMEFPKRPGKPEEFAQAVISCIGMTMLNGEVIRLDGASRMPARL